jgi:23S rRNA pseudouridine1911/1915/1917 synthase
LEAKSSDTIIVVEEERGKRLDKLLAERFPDSSRTYFQSLIERGLVLLNGDLAKKRVQPEPGDEIEIEFALTPEISLDPEEIPLTILYEDEDLLAIDKPPGMVVHPGAGHFSGTFVNALLFHCKGLKGGDRLRPGIVHRLDKETSGLLLAAKNEMVHQKLVAQFAARDVKKEYVAICLGRPKEGLIEGPIGRHPTKRKEMTIVLTGKEARTVVKVVKSNGLLSSVRLFPETGRTHQLRVHLKSIGSPILGDSVYGSEHINTKYQVSRQLLHAERLRFTHPVTGKDMDIRAEIPADIQKFIDQLS